MNHKFLTGLIIGAVAGVAIALLLNTEKGQEIMDDIADAAGDVADTAREQLGNLQDELGGLLKKGKAFVEDLEHTVKEATS